jgi:tripartite-type tricarboxylate transporter receptor subunit TctC
LVAGAALSLKRKVLKRNGIGRAMLARQRIKTFVSKSQSERVSAALARVDSQRVVENRPGAGGNIAAEAVVRASPDGYTLLAIGSNNMINATLYQNLNFDFIRDIAPVASIYRVAQVMEVNPSFPAKTVLEFIAYAKANPGKITFASAGVGSVAHVTGELFKMMTGIDMLHVPYRGAPPGLTDLVDGQVQVMFDNLPSSIALIRAGKLRPLAVTSLTRLEALPEVPTMDESVSGFETSAWAGIGAPKICGLQVLCAAVPTNAIPSLIATRLVQ